MMLYVKQIRGKQYTVRDTGLKFTIFINGKETCVTFTTLADAVQHLNTVVMEEENVRFFKRTLLPFIIVVCVLVTVALR